jgi:hypothetical protein
MTSPGKSLLSAAASIALSATLGAQAPAPPAPSPKPAAAAPSAEAQAAGKQLFAKVVVWLGGEQKVAGVKDVQTRGQLTAKTPEGDATMEVQSAMVFPDRLFQQIDSPYGRIAMIVTPTEAFLFGPNGSQDLPPVVRGELLKQIQRIPLHLVQKASDPRLVTAAAGKSKIGAIEASMLDIRYGEVAVRWYIDPATGKILRTEHTTTTPEGKPAQMVSEYSDYKPVDGFPIAHRLDVSTNGEKDQTLVMEECKINAGVDPKLFEKPLPAPTPTPAATN